VTSTKSVDKTGKDSEGKTRQCTVKKGAMYRETKGRRRHIEKGFEGMGERAPRKDVGQSVKFTTAPKKGQTGQTSTLERGARTCSN